MTRIFNHDTGMMELFLPEGMIEVSNAPKQGYLIDASTFEEMKQDLRIQASNGQGFWSTETHYHPELDVYAVPQPDWTSHVVWLPKEINERAIDQRVEHESDSGNTTNDIGEVEN